MGDIEEADAAAAPDTGINEDNNNNNEGRINGGNIFTRRVIITILVITFTILLVTSPLFLAITKDKHKSDDREMDCYKEEECDENLRTGNDSICERNQCIMAASRIQVSLNNFADPCQNFYEFACGRWNEESASVAPSFNTLQKHINQEIQYLLSREAKATSGPFIKLGQFYASCLNSRRERITTNRMFNLLDELGGYIQSTENVNNNDLTKLVSSLLKVNGASLFDLYIHSDPYKKSKLAIFLDLPVRNGQFSNFFPQRLQKLFRHIRDTDQSKEFKFIKASAEQKRLLTMERLLQMFLPSNMPTNEKALESQRILLFTLTLSKILPKEKEIMSRRQTRKHLTKYTIEQLQNKFGFLEWKNLIESIFSTKVNDSNLVYVINPNYMERLNLTMNAFDKRIVHNGLLLLYSGDILYELINGTVTSEWGSFCSRITTEIFSGPVSALYVRQFTEKQLNELQDRVNVMFETLKSTFETRIIENSWLDDTSKKSVYKKLELLHGQFFTFPHFRNETFVNKLMEHVIIKPDDFFENVIERYRQIRKFDGNLILENQSFERRWAYPFIVNAFYENSVNSIVIPLAVLTQPYFQSDMPKYIPYGTMGLIFTHEILHGFDLTGIEFDEHGERRTILTEQTQEILNEKIKCVVKQYTQKFQRQVEFLGSNVNVQFDWNVTKNENMADISGLQIAYLSWKKLHKKIDPRLPELTFTPEQLFFISAAQTYCYALSPEDYILTVEMDFHAPFPERVNGIMMNSYEFSKAFHCKKETFMNPSKKCSIW